MKISGADLLDEMRDIPCTPEEIKARMDVMQKAYEADMAKPHLFWKEMGLDHVGGHYMCFNCGHHPEEHIQYDPQDGTRCNELGCQCMELE